MRLGRLSLDGDGQADPRVHDGEHKAACAWLQEHDAWWQRERGRHRTAPGQFGENVTASGLRVTLLFAAKGVEGNTALLTTGPAESGDRASYGVNRCAYCALRLLADCP